MVWILVSISVNSPPIGHAIKTNSVKRLDCWSRGVLNFDYLEKGLGLVYPRYFLNDISRKIFLMFSSISSPHFIVWLPLLLETLGNMCIATVFYPFRDVINFDIYLSFFIKSFSYMTEKFRPKIEISQERKVLLTHSFPMYPDDFRK